MTTLIAPDEVSAQGSLFREVTPGSIWSRLCFQPLWDPVDMVQTAFNVKAKNTKIVPFNLFRTQRLFADRIGLKNVEVKPRQVGATTFKLALETAIACTTPNVNVLVVSHRDDATETIRETISNFIKWLNEFYDFGIVVGRNNEDMLEIRSTGSWFYFGSSTAPGVGRSRTIHILHATELAHWMGPNPGKELAGMTESMPDNGLEFIESTPNGADGPFYDIYSSQNSYTKHFFPWFIEPSRKLILPVGRTLHLTEEERMLSTMHGLSQDQIAWRRMKWRDLEARGLYFPQEYPEDDQTCFMAGLRTAFPVAKLTEFLQFAKIKKFSDTDVPGDATDPGGELRVWEEPIPGVSYAVCCDVGGGHKDGDASVAMVRNARTGDHVATLAGHWNPRRFADESMQLARRYNIALLSHETTGIGVEAARRCVEMAYPNYYYELRESHGDEWMPGFNVSPTIRNRMLSRVVAEVSSNLFRSFDERLIRQMSAARLERRRVAGAFGDAIALPANQHDDYLMCYAQSCLILEYPMISSDQRAKPGNGA